jgi:Methyltransferase domain
LNHLRPHKLFNLVKTDSFAERTIKLILPEQRTPVLLESAILLALGRLIRPRKFFEFGTYLGVETLNMAANLPEDTHLYTLDIDPIEFEKLQQDAHDRPLSLTHFENQQKLAFLHTPYEKRITRLLGDSNKFDFSQFHKRMDMIYVDGGHDLQTLISDTKNALAMLSEDRAACVAWHDYSNPLYPQVQEYLDGMAESREMFHIEGSWIVFFLANAASLVKDLKQ